LGLLDAARGKEQAFALDYLAHLAADVVAHNFFLPARFVGHFSIAASGSHIYEEACFDSLQESDYRDLLLKLCGSISARSIGFSNARSIPPLVGFGTLVSFRRRRARRIRE
jgi:hypothetical protein